MSGHRPCGSLHWREATACGVAVLLFGAGTAAAQSAPAPLESVERRAWVMGTHLQIRALGAQRSALEGAVQAAEAELRRIEDLATDWRPSPLTLLNAAAGSGPRVVPRELAALISRGLEVGRLTRGAFDISYAGVGHLWNFNRRQPRVPEAAAIAKALGQVGFERIGVDPATNAVTLPAGMRVGLGGIAKGYGVDRAVQTLLEHGVEHALVNAGGDLKALGRDGQRPWEVAVKHPRDRERVIAVLRLSNSALVTSGDYERFFEIRGKRFHHILDPRTGYPSRGAMSATVIAPSAEFADALATALCVLGANPGLEIIDSLERVEAILVDMDGVAHASAGLRASLR